MSGYRDKRIGALIKEAVSPLLIKEFQDPKVRQAFIQAINKDAVVKAVDACAVKAHINNPPVFEVVAGPAK